MKKIAIVGTCPTSSGEAPYGDGSWEIWSLGKNFSTIPRFTRWFELHRMEVLKSCPADPALYHFVQNAGNKAVIGYPQEIYPEAKVFPWEEIIKKFGRYSNCSLTHMIQLALYEGCDEIGLWGVHMTAGEEYYYQRACCEYYLGKAEGMGIKVTIAPESPLLKCERIYALEYTQLAKEIIERKREIKAAVEKACAEEKKALFQQAYLKGQEDIMNQMEGRWG